MSDKDTIYRQAAIDTIMGQPPEPHYPSWYAEQIEKLPVTQPEIIRCKDCCNDHWCIIQEAAMAGDNFFCGAAERRTDE